MRGVAVNVGANTNEPGFRGPIYADGSFEYVPIPERDPTPPAADLDRRVTHLSYHTPDSTGAPRQLVAAAEGRPG
jgi:hypothetical protein